jgi:uncharacterized membrane protein
MGTGRVEAFSDGVIAVIATIMVLDLHVPHEATWAAFASLGPGLAIYAISYATIGVMWMNHHHLLHGAQRADAPLMWANLGLLFTMSLVPFATAWVAEAFGMPTPVALYGLVLFACSIAYAALAAAIAFQQIAGEGAGNPVLRSFARKGTIVGVLYLVAIPLAYVSVLISYAIFVCVLLLYALPDRRLTA